MVGNLGNNDFIGRSVMWGLLLFIVPSLYSQEKAPGPPDNPGNGQITDPVIDNVQLVTPNPICAGSEIEFTFDVTNGNDSNTEYFTSDTEYTIELRYTNQEGDITSVTSLQYKFDIAPVSKNFETENISGTLNIPASAPASVSYEFAITSINPTNSADVNSISNAFVVKTENIWTGAVSNIWNEKGNWECNLLPTKYTDVVIPSGLVNYPTINAGANALARDLIIETGASVIVDNNWLRIAGDLQNSGVLNAGNGSISFEGSSAQTIPIGAFESNSILNLNIDNLAGVTSETTVEIINSLKVTSGIFETGSDLTLISNAPGTAFIDGSGGGQITGTVKMQRFLDNGFGYKYFSTPFQTTKVGDFSTFMDLTAPAPSGFPHFYEYKENREDPDGNDLTGWQVFTQSENILNIGEGYALNISGTTAPVTIEILGEVNNGLVNIDLQNNNGKYTNGFNLIGNPYPSPIDWDLMVPDLVGIDNAIYFFTAGSYDATDENSRYKGTYSSYVNEVYTNATTSIIPSMQGFFVRVSDPADNVYPATATLSFTNAVRTGNEVNQEFYKSKSKPAKPQIRLTAGFANEKASDAAVIYFNDGASTEFESDLDAFKLLNTAVEVPSLYSLTQTQQKLSINAVNSANTREVPLGINTEMSGKMSIKLADVQNIFPSVHIYLKDQKNKIVHNLSEHPEYSFTSKKGESNDRFVLLLSSEKFSAAEMDLAVEPVSVYSEKGEILVKLNLPSNTFGTITINNISGQILQKKSAKEKEEIRFNGIPAPGIYFVSLEWENERITKKILLKK